MSIAAMAQCYKTRPSALIGLESEYEAYCFDEAVAYIIYKLRNEEKPNFKTNTEDSMKHYRSFSDLYKKYDN